ncbi:unnamed protein product [Linum tenue]|uniref:Uncharacterized protein n=1 Tax=Linum tenue TaxID=586396 RepID=A0AAV0MK19_9ROSI|nr:unnamed protein product [Linum tenue]
MGRRRPPLLLQLLRRRSRRFHFRERPIFLRGTRLAQHAERRDKSDGRRVHHGARQGERQRPERVRVLRRPGGRRRPRRPHSPWASLPEVLEGHLSVHLSVRRRRPSWMGRLALRRPRAKFRLRRGGL